MKQTTIKCGWLVSMDERIGDLANAEILIKDDRIVAIGHDLNATSDEVIDASDMIVMPGLVNAHIHLWQCGLRGIGSEWAGGDYFVHIHGNLATHYGPQDNYLGNLVGSLAQIDGGVTTALDWCHNLKSLEQAERSIDALEETGLRTVFAHGTAKPPTAPGGTPYSQIPHPRDRVQALRKGRLASDRGRVTMAMAILGPHYSTWDVVVEDLALAREFNLLSTSHATKRKQDCVTPNGYLRLAQEGLIGPEHNIVHANFFEDDELQAVVEVGASVTPTVLVELHSDFADPLTPRLRALGALPSLGNDVEPIVSGDMFREMQAALLHARAVANRQNRAAGGAPFRISPVRSREALEWATIGGARALRLENRIGSLTPGKKADLVMLRSTDLNLFPVHNPIYSIVEQANAGNVDTVMIDGIFRKRGGKLTFPADVLRQRQRELAASADRIMRAGNFTVLAA
jgi:5-methylthioadenosine/S-adenosylhomocysteine deaminase